MRDSELKVVDLFCGCGGMSMGFEKAGFNVVASYDNWDPAIAVYRLNFQHPIYKRDLLDTKDVSDIASHKPDVIIGILAKIFRVQDIEMRLLAEPISPYRMLI